MRLQQFLALASLGSRRKCELLIQEKKVRVNGKLAFLGQKVNPDTDRIEVNGAFVKPDAEQCWILYKPRGYLSTVSDPHGRKTILDLVNIKNRVYPVGRLDKDSEGLIFLTNNGDLAYCMTHPKFGIDKVYEVIVKGSVSRETLKRIEKGILLEDGITAPCKIRILKKAPDKAILEIKLQEGKKREIRRMMESFGLGILSLKRTRIGPLTVFGLEPGKLRSLTKEEIQALKKYAARKSRKSN